MRWGKCGRKARRVKDRRSRRWRHLDLAGMTVHLKYSIRLVHCDACGTVKTERVPWAAPDSGFTHAFEERAAYLTQQSSSTAVSKLLRVTWRTVGRIIRRVVHRELEASGDRLDGLKHIGIDELSYTNSSPSTTSPRSIGATCAPRTRSNRPSLRSACGTTRTKGSGSRIACLTMVFKLAQAAERNWRRLTGHVTEDGWRDVSVVHRRPQLAGESSQARYFGTSLSAAGSRPTGRPAPSRRPGCGR